MAVDQVEVNCVTLENGREYIIVDAIINDNGKYLVLASETNQFDHCVRKVIVEEGKEYITKLDTEEEFDEVMKDFYFRHNKEREDKNEE
ncbi:MAG: hypothetical protein E7161_00370 [Firmicutes bacterium]|nr:hypothetical protein [Bacillota bacterium]